MDYDTIGSTLGFATVFLSIVAALVSIALLVKVAKMKKRPTKHILYVFFTIYALAFVVWTIAENSYFWPLYLFEAEVFPGPSDIFYVLGYLIQIVAFGYLGWHLMKDEKEGRRNTAILASAAIVITIFQYLLISRYVFPYLEGDFLAQFLNLYYPIASAFFLMMAVAVFMVFKKMKIVAPMIFIVIGALSAFLGDTLFSFASVQQTYGLIGTIADSFYVTDYAANVVAFVFFYRYLK